MGPSVSVLVPAYNVASWVEGALASALASRDVDLEVVVVDDGSTDQTAEVAEAVAARDPRVVVVRQSENLGPSAARNVALAHATKPWVAALDADDAFAPDRLARLVALGEATGADVVSDDVAIVRDGEDTTWTTMYQAFDWRRAEGHRLTLAEFADLDWIIQPVFRRSFLDRYDLRYREDVRHGEDFLFYTRALLSGARWVTAAEAGYFYRRREGSLTLSGSHVADNLVATRAALEAVESSAPPRDVSAFRRRLAREREMTAWGGVRRALQSDGVAAAAMEALRRPTYWLPFGRIMWAGLRRRVVRWRTTDPV